MNVRDKEIPSRAGQFTAGTPKGRAGSGAAELPHEHHSTPVTAPSVHPTWFSLLQHACGYDDKVTMVSRGPPTQGKQSNPRK